MARARQPYELSDAGNAQRFADSHHGGIAYVDGRWYVRDVHAGEPWAPATYDELAIRAHGTLFTLHALANQTKDDDERRATTTWAIRSESDYAILRMIRLASSDPRIARTLADIGVAAA